ncbi:MAG: hypothetical protein HC888_12975 [Candidatus Competibacteraceae bacterium]|nr:hypothetical protein [Candidatus Competibacteraceae bacterium]
MRHLRTVTRTPAPAQEGTTTLIETIVIVVFGVFFADWDNGPQVLQNLSKYFGKTP